MQTVLSSATRETVIGPGEPFCIIGERINPTGRKIFQQQLRDGDLSRVETDVGAAGGERRHGARRQHGRPAGGRGRADGPARSSSSSASPTCRCASTPRSIEVLDAGLAAYEGKALVNSVTAEDERLEAILPLVARYGAAVIALPNDEEEIPEDPRRRVELAAQGHRRGDREVRHRHRGHRDRPARHAGRGGHHARGSRRSRRSRCCARSSA